MGDLTAAVVLIIIEHMFDISSPEGAKFTGISKYAIIKPPPHRGSGAQTGASEDLI